jgi:hypothetical protein
MRNFSIEGLEGEVHHAVRGEQSQRPASSGFDEFSKFAHDGGVGCLTATVGNMRSAIEEGIVFPVERARKIQAVRLITRCTQHLTNLERHGG